MSVLDLVRAELRDFAGYSSARKEAACGEVWLNANESPWPPAGESGATLNRYPDPQPSALAQRFAALYGVDAARVLVTRGSDEGIDLLVRALCRAGRDGVVACPPTFGMYAVAARVQDAPLHAVPLSPHDFALDVDAVVDVAVSCGARLVFLCSPNNPTGNALSLHDVSRIAAALAHRAVVVVDEAYTEFSDAPGATTLLATHDNLAVLRTLSKAHALAGARVGATLAHPDLLRVLRAIMAPYPLPAPSVAAALRALQDDALAETRRRIATLRAERARVAQSLRALPCVREVYASDANFLLVSFVDAAEAMHRAAAAGVVLRDVSRQPGLAGCLRITIGLAAENDRALAALAARREAA